MAVSRVLISYAHENAEHTGRVEQLHERLHSADVGVVRDADFAGPGRLWREWMGEQVRLADFVLVIASPQYGHRAPDDVPVDQITGRGSWYESSLLGAEVYADEGRRSLTRILPVVLPGGSVDDLPDYFFGYSGTFYAIGELTADGVADLVRVLRREPMPAGGVAPGFAPLRLGVTADVRIDADGVYSRVSVANEALGEPPAIAGPARRGVVGASPRAVAGRGGPGRRGSAGGGGAV